MLAGPELYTVLCFLVSEGAIVDHGYDEGAVMVAVLA